ncbi:Retrovirus-related Pol polyprotein from transposon 17.6 [Eumeta japonica]|uniref:Retrovirus-related Pol polyprotein from transposon 17.6 n=1 Tax=Eumeta variegata TaxID=151549 RepID=A0A4C1ZC41_EUMVA|nr:Retrovirus-related Pol polyprotein from transposon 17.6 [Eumeta japonica]
MQWRRYTTRGRRRHQVEIDSRDKKKECVLNENGPMVVQYYDDWVFNAPATFKRLMEQVLVELTEEACTVWLNDVIVIEKDFDDHLQKLKQVLLKIPDANKEKRSAPQRNGH